MPARCETVTDASQEPALSTHTLPSFGAIAAKRGLVLLLAQVTPASGCSEQSIGMDVRTSGTGPRGAAVLSGREALGAVLPVVCIVVKSPPW